MVGEAWLNAFTKQAAFIIRVAMPLVHKRENRLFSADFEPLANYPGGTQHCLTSLQPGDRQVSESTEIQERQMGLVLL